MLNDVNGRITQLLHTQADGTLLAGTGYTLAADGKRTELREYDSQSSIVNGQTQNPARTSRYGYDGSGRLIQEDISDRDGTVLRSIAYRYDKVGNRLQKTLTTPGGSETTAYVYDADDRLVTETKTANGSVLTTRYTWDANGHLSQKSETGKTILYGWDSQDHLVEVKQGADTASAQTIALYRYDALGNRVKKVKKTPQGDQTTSYLVDTTFPYAQVVEEKVQLGTQTETTHTLWGLGPIAQSQNGQTAYYHTDALGSIKALTDSAGQVTDAYEYEAFGALQSHSGSSAQPYRFAGEHYDPEAGMQYHRARWYDAETGRFTALDLFSGNPARPATLHKYAYAGEDPVNGVDPSGLFTMGEVGVANDIAVTLSNLQVDFGFNFIDAKLSGDDYSASSMGWSVLASMAPLAIANIAKKTLTVTSNMGRYGKVAYLTAKKPLGKEIEAAEFLSEQLGLGIYVRGGKSTQGADFFMNGVKWELKTLEKSSVNAVFQNIKTAVKKQSSRVIVDGRKVGLELDVFNKGLAEAQRKGYYPSEILILIKKDGVDTIVPWPL